MYAMPTAVSSVLYLLSEAIEAGVSAVAYRGIAAVSGVESTGAFGIADLSDVPYAYLGTPGHMGREFVASAA